MSVLLGTLQELGEREMERKAGNREEGKELHQKGGKRRKLDPLVRSAEMHPTGWSTTQLLWGFVLVQRGQSWMPRLMT